MLGGGPNQVVVALMALASLLLLMMLLMPCSGPMCCGCDDAMGVPDDADDVATDGSILLRGLAGFSIKLGLGLSAETPLPMCATCIEPLLMSS